MAKAIKGGFQKGAEHFGVKEVTQAKAKVLELVRAGNTLQSAMVALGKKPDTARIWMMRDPALLAHWKKQRKKAPSSPLMPWG